MSQSLQNLLDQFKIFNLIFSFNGSKNVTKDELWLGGKAVMPPELESFVRYGFLDIESLNALAHLGLEMHDTLEKYGCVLGEHSYAIPESKVEAVKKNLDHFLSCIDDVVEQITNQYPEKVLKYCEEKLELRESNKPSRVDIRDVVKGFHISYDENAVMSSYEGMDSMKHYLTMCEVNHSGSVLH